MLFPITGQKITGGTTPVGRFVRPPRHGSPLLVAR